MATEFVFLPSSPSQWHARNLYKDCDVLFLLGPAGTGKTHTAMALAMSDVQAQKYRKVVMTRPLVGCGETLGFHKGSVDQKLAPWMGSASDVLGNITFTKQSILQQAGKLEFLPLAYMRGRTIDRSIAILDEAQNCTYAQLVMFLTRLGNASKLILCGDQRQFDIATPALMEVVGRLEGTPGIGVAHFAGEHTARHPLVHEMLLRLDQSAVRPQC